MPTLEKTWWWDTYKAFEKRKSWALELDSKPSPLCMKWPRPGQGQWGRGQSISLTKPGIHPSFPSSHLVGSRCTHTGQTRVVPDTTNLPAVWAWALAFPSLPLLYLLCQTGTVNTLPSRWWSSACEALSTGPSTQRVPCTRQPWRQWGIAILLTPVDTFSTPVRFKSKQKFRLEHTNTKY